MLTRSGRYSAGIQLDLDRRDARHAHTAQSVRTTISQQLYNVLSTVCPEKYPDADQRPRLNYALQAEPKAPAAVKSRDETEVSIWIAGEMINPLTNSMDLPIAQSFRFWEERDDGISRTLDGSSPGGRA